MFCKFSELFYLVPTKNGTEGVVVDSHNNPVGRIVQRGDYWEDMLTHNFWDCPIGAAHTYIFARLPENNHNDKHALAIIDKRDVQDDWKAARALLCTVLDTPCLRAHVPKAVRKAVRLMDKHLLRDEVAI